MNTTRFVALALIGCMSSHAAGQLSPEPAQAGHATTIAAAPLSRDVEAALSRYGGVKSVKVVLETDKNIEDKAVRMELVMTSDRRFAQRFWNLSAGDGSASSSEHVAAHYSDDTIAYFAFCDSEYMKARRGTLDMYIRHDATVGWEPSPGPTFVALAPWPVMREVAQRVAGTPSATKEHDATLLLLGDTKHVLRFGANGSLQSWATGAGPTQEVTEYVDAAQGDRLPALPTRIVQRYPQRGDKTPARTVEWRVVSASFNPPDAEQRLDFAPIAAKFKRFDPDTGDITNPDGSIAGREIQPAAMAVDAWDRHTRTKAWSSVFKWGSIATGMFVLAFVMELIRRRL